MEKVNRSLIFEVLQHRSVELYAHAHLASVVVSCFVAAVCKYKGSHRPAADLEECYIDHRRRQLIHGFFMVT